VAREAAAPFVLATVSLVFSRFWLIRKLARPFAVAAASICG